jgi:hypothetical protein
MPENNPNNPERFTMAKQIVNVQVSVPCKINARGQVKTVRIPVTAKFTRFKSPITGIISTRVEANGLPTLTVFFDPEDASVTGLIHTTQFSCEGRSEKAVWKKLVKAGWM